MSWCVYLVRCSDSSLYCGVTTQVARRVSQHNGVRTGGAKYTKGRRPVQLVWASAALPRCSALKLEAVIKRMSKGTKEQMVAAEELRQMAAEARMRQRQMRELEAAT